MADDTTKPASKPTLDALAKDVDAKSKVLETATKTRDDLLGKLNEATGAEAKAQAEFDAARSALRAAVG